MNCVSAAYFVCALVVSGLFFAWLPNASAQTGKEKPVATIGDEAIYEKDYLPQIQKDLMQIRQQEYEFKLKALENAINKRLLRAEAKKLGVTEDELLLSQADSKVVEPSQDERDQAIAQRMLGMGNPLSAVGAEFDSDLMKEKVQQAREEYFQTLREKAGVKIYLLPPTVQVDYDRARVRGNADAKIVMVEFSDFQCPFCLQAYTTVKNLLKKYDGKIKLAYRDLPLLPVAAGVPGSADASRCAGEQGKYWEYHDLLFENQDEVGEAAFRDHAEALKLDLKQFETCLKSGKFKPSIQQDFQEGIRLGLTGTPGFFINGVVMKGAQPQSEFEEIIDTELYLMGP